MMLKNNPSSPRCESNRFLRVATLAAVLFLASQVTDDHSFASDHADPIKVRFFGRPESNLTGLFVFEEKEKLVLVLCARPGLAMERVRAQRLQFDIHLDCHSRVNFHDPKGGMLYQRPSDIDEGRTYRYGGWIQKPTGISSDLTFSFQFPGEEADPIPSNFALGAPIDLKPKISGPWKDKIDASKVQSWVGMRDDPFILQGFSTTNVLAFVVEIPFSSLNGRDEFLVWGSCSMFGDKIDHVGRSLRTMLPRFDFLNALHPSKHKEAILRQHESPGVMQDLLAFGAGPIFGIRHYDFEPDVVIFSLPRWKKQQADYLERLDSLGQTVADTQHGRKDLTGLSAFPNGRRLTDDVAWLMCERGDCLLFEVSTAEAHAAEPRPVPRPTSNGKPFLSEFPYLAEPNEFPMPSESPRLRARTILILVVAALGIVAFFVVPWILFVLTRRKLNRLRQLVRSSPDLMPQPH